MKLQKEDIALKIESVIINPSNSVRDLGVLLDNEFTMRPRISKIASACFYHLRRLRQLRRLVNRAMMQRLVSAFVITRLEFHTGWITSMCIGAASTCSPRCCSTCCWSWTP